MSYLFEVAKLILNGEIKNRINTQINKIQDFIDLSKFEIGFPLNNVDVHHSSYEDLLHEKNIWEELAKLSIDLWNDYEHYRRFNFKSRYESKMYVDRLESLGFVYDGHRWRNKDRPAIEDVQMNVLMFCLCHVLSVRRGLDDDANQRNKDNERRQRDNDLADKDHARDLNPFKTDLPEEKAVNTKVGVKCQSCDCYNDIDAKNCGICDTFFVKYGIELDDNGGNKDQTGDVWRCSSCTFNNKLENESCEVCSSSRKSKDEITEGIVCGAETWQCPSCTFNNSFESRCCEACYTIKDTEVQSENGEVGDVVDIVEEVEEVTETWKCGHCQSDNLVNSYVCAHCHKYAPFFHKWRCERCSFFNTELCPLCAVCGHKNRHINKCEKCGKNDVNINNGGTCAACVMTVGDTGPHHEGKKDASKDKSDDVPKDKKDDAIRAKKKSTSGQKVSGVCTMPTENRKCAMCKNNLRKTEEGICSRCEASKYYCNNQWCGTINNKGDKHCSKCGLKKGSNVTEYNTVEAHNGTDFVQMWQCTFCGLFNCQSKCAKCENQRHGPTNKKCSCNWVNPPNEERCYKCFRKLK